MKLKRAKNKGIEVLRFKRVKNETKMVVIFKREGLKLEMVLKFNRVKNEANKWFSRSNESRLKLNGPHLQTSKDEPRRFEVETSKE